jgi:hypothetical protein
MKSIRDIFLRGVYGEHSKHNNLNYGGPECAALLPTEFKIMTLLVLVSLLIFITMTASLLNLLLEVCFERNHASAATKIATALKTKLGLS